MKTIFRHSLTASIFFLLVIILVSCEESAQKKKVKPYFDIEEYLKKETGHLTAISAYFLKSLDSDGKTDEIKNEHPNWKVELQLFYEADINKANSIGRMQVDTLKDRMDSTHQRFDIVYTPLDKSIKVKELKISFGPNRQVMEIQAHVESSSALDSIATNLHYIARKYYEIDTKEHTVLTGDSYYIVKGNIITQDKYFQ